MSEVTPEIQTQAKDMGWVDKDQFRGDPEKWVDADVFLDRGQHVLPIVKKQRDDFKVMVQNLQLENKQVMKLLSSAMEEVQGLKAYNEEISKRSADAALANLRERKKLARKENDVDTELEIDAAISEVQKQIDGANAPKAKPNGEAAKATAAVDPITTVGIDPAGEEFRQWKAANPWVDADRKLTAQALGLLHHYNQTEGLRGVELLNRVAEDINAFRSAGQRREAPLDKVEGGGRGGGSPAGGGARGKTYADLPSDAKRACDKYAETLVGPAKSFKTVAEWREKYVQDYFKDEQK